MCQMVTRTKVKYILEGIGMCVEKMVIKHLIILLLLNSIINQKIFPKMCTYIL